MECRGALVRWPPDALRPAASLPQGLPPVCADTRRVHDENQTPLPASFIALFVSPGRSRPTESRAHIGERHEFCDDLAHMLTEHASTRLFELGVAEHDVLERIHAGLLGPGAVVSAAEAWWVVQRLAELLGWPPPAGPAAPA